MKTPIHLLLCATATIALGSLAACVPQKPFTTLGETDWSSPLDADLHTAASQLSADLAAAGYPGVRVLWAGARAREYTILRGPTGEPVRKYAQVAYAFQLADGKCFVDLDFSTLGSGPMLARDNEGGGRYAEPHIRGFAPPKGGYGGRHEIVCDAVAKAKGGIHDLVAGP